MSRTIKQLFAKTSAKLAVLAAVITTSVLVIVSGASAAQAPINLGNAESFAVLAGSGITNTGSTIVSGSAGGDMGSSPTGTFTGSASVVTSGTKYLAVSSAVTSAKSSLLTAYNDAAGRGPASTITADLAGQTLQQGVYKSSSSIGLSGTLTLDAENDPDAVFVFQAGSTLTTGSGSSVELINGAQACNVYWQVGSSATFGTTTDFVGHVLALTSITANTGASFEGQLLARNGAVTLDTNRITNDLCDVPVTPTPTETTTVTPTPTPTTPTATPTETPTVTPTATPTETPTVTPTATPTETPTVTPTATPTPTPSPSDSGTTDGGELPNTEGIDWLVSLAIGLGMILIGSSVLLLRKRLSK